MKKYDSYKDSGVEWIGEVPTHWGVDILNRIFKINTGFTPSTSNNEFYENGVHDWITIRDLDGKYVSESKTKLTDIAVQGKTIIPKGSLLYSFKLSVGQMAFTTKDIYTNEAIFSVFPSEKLNLNYYYYLLDRILIHNSNENIYGAKILNQELIKASKLLVPPEEEQTVIANFLDHKTTQINDLISKKEQFIQLLEEERVAVINQAVTKGLDPSVSMKDSGVEWLGEIPEHWEISKFGFEVIIKRGAGYQYIEQTEQDDFEPVIRISDFKNFEPLKAIPRQEFNNYRIKKGDILIAGTGATAGICIMSDNKMEGMVHSYNALRLIPKKSLPYFLYYCLDAHFVNEQKNLAFTGSAQPFLDVGRISNLLLAIPSIEEQNKVVEFIETQIKRIQTIVDKTKQEIELLKEYKTALISEVVTGKVDVRNEKLN